MDASAPIPEITPEPPVLPLPSTPRPRRSRADYGWLSGLAVLVLAVGLVWGAVAQRPDGLLHLYVLDVGQGDALLLTTPQGRTVLVDGGPDPSRLLAQVGRYLPFWQRKLDLLVLTHPHEDHLAGLVEVLRRYEVGAVVVTPYTTTGALAAAWDTALTRQHLTAVPVVRGAVIDVEPGLAVRVLAPGPLLLRGTHSDINNASVVLQLVYGQVRMLLTGDVEAEAVARLLAEPDATAVQAAVLKVPHHGGADDLDSRLLAAVRPQVALISVGSDNPYGHPAPSILADLSAAQVPVYRTDQKGTVDVSSDGAHLWVKTER